MNNHYYGLIRKDIFPLVPQQAGKILDVGGGYGGTSSELKRQGKASQIVLVDLVADEHDPAVDKAYAGNLEDPDFLQKIIDEQGPFDTILCLDVLEHLTDPWSVVKNLHKGLSDGGVIVASVPNMRHVRLVLPLVFKGEFELTDKGLRDRTHLRWFVRDTAIRLMECSGLKVEQVIGRVSLDRWHKWTNFCTFGLFKRFFEIQYLIRVRNGGAK